MEKGDISFLLVMIASSVAYFAWTSRKRATMRTPQPPVQNDEAAIVANNEIAVVPSARMLTARERRHEEIRQLAQGARCIYCSAPAEHPLPYAEFVRPSIDIAALTTGDLPKHWRVRVPVTQDVVPILCLAHSTIARSAVELRIAKAHAEYVEFVAQQKETLHEFTAFGLDETLRSEAERVRKGSSKGTT